MRLGNRTAIVVSPLRTYFLTLMSSPNSTTEAKLQEALQAVISSGLTSQGKPVFSLRAAAKQYDVSRSALTARWNGRGTRAESHAHQQKLSPSQELILKEWIKVMGRRGMLLA